MIVAVDVHYFDDGATTGVVGFDSWEKYEPPNKAAGLAFPNHWTDEIKSVQPYESGNFYKRELPCILSILEMIIEENKNHAWRKVKIIVVDGHVDVGIGKPGLGRHLFQSLNEKVPIVGVAKNEFKDAPAQPVLRGGSQKPLWVSAAGISVQDAVDGVKAMEGAFRLPTALRFVDHLARGLL